MVTCTRGNPTHCSNCGSLSLMTAQLVSDSSSVGHLAACITWNKESRETCKQQPQWGIHLYRQQYISAKHQYQLSLTYWQIKWLSPLAVSDVYLMHQFCAGTFMSCWLVASVLWDCHWITTCVQHFSYFICFIINISFFPPPVARKWKRRTKPTTSQWKSLIKITFNSQAVVYFQFIVIKKKGGGAKKTW